MPNHAVARLVTLLCLGFLSTTQPSRAQVDPSIEKVQFKQSQMHLCRAGVFSPMQKEVLFPNEITIRTNGTFRVKQGQERRLQEGQALGSDGMLLSPDGSIAPVIDHVAIGAGQVRQIKDGQSAPLTADLTLANGAQITPGAYHISPSGTRTRLLEGQMFSLDGQPIPAKDTVLLQDGRVLVQKDGTQFIVEPGRNLMMNDGTKVLGDGTLHYRDGRTRKLSPGEVATLDGVIRRVPER